MKHKIPITAKVFLNIFFHKMLKYLRHLAVFSEYRNGSNNIYWNDGAV